MTPLEALQWLTVATVVVSVFTSGVTALAVLVLTHRIRIHVERRRGRRRSYQLCALPVADADDPRDAVPCIRRKYHPGQCATTVGRLRAAGYERAPF